MCAGIWLVRAQNLAQAVYKSKSTYILVRGVVQPEDSSDFAQSASAGLKDARNSAWIRFWVGLMSKLLL
jgi:hypothetical protein